MQTLLTPDTGRHDHPPQPTHHRTPRVNALDRLALHVGIALIKWGRRPRTVESRERRASVVEQRIAQAERSRLAERALRLSVPPR